MLIPYIGITDFMTFEQIERMLKIFKRHMRRGSDRELHVGVMTSFKVMNGLETKWEKAFPKTDAIASIFSSDETYNCLHIVDYQNQPGLPATLSRAIELGGTGIHAVQLDMIWPDPAHVAEGVHRSRKNVEVILQIGAKALEAVDDDPKSVVEALEDYDGIIHRVLLDKSMGRGVGMDAETLAVFGQAIKRRFPQLGLVFAGGLGPDTMHLVEPLIGEFPNMSIDAQGKLRPSGNALDPIDWNMAERYLIRALQLFD